jgi:hypothetical protein
LVETYARATTSAEFRIVSFLNNIRKECSMHMYRNAGFAVSFPVKQTIEK